MLVATVSTTIITGGGAMRHFLDTIDTIPAGMGFSYFHPFHLCWLGGIALAISSQLSLPIYRIGVGESIDDLQSFDALEFCRALVGEGM